MEEKAEGAYMIFTWRNKAIKTFEEGSHLVI